MRKFKKKLVLPIILSFTILGGAVFGIIYLPNRLHNKVTIEAGEISELDEAQFLLANNEGVFESNVKSIDLLVPGKYSVGVKVGFMTYHSTLLITDTIKPILKLREIVSPVGKAILPEVFVLEASDKTKLTYSFSVAPDPSKIGEQTVEIKATDMGGNATIEKTTVLISQVRDKVTIEAGLPAPLIQDFLLKDRTTETFVTNMSSLKLIVGTYPIEIKMESRTLLTQLVVVDTIAPTGNAVALNAYVGDILAAASFVKEIKDASKVIVTFKETTNFTASAGTFAPIVILTDISGNKTEITGKLVVISDTLPPVLSGSGLTDRSVFIGESFNVRSQVYATDNRDGRMTVYVDGSVNFNRVGAYSITFSAKDKAGNTASKHITVTVKTHPPFVSKGDTGNAALNTLVDNLFRQLLHGDMSTYQVTRILYDFGRTIKYMGGALATNPWQDRAISTLTSRVGNCYGRMYAMQALFTRAGITNREREQYNQAHSWNQVNIGSGWQNVDIAFSDTFLVTDASLRNKALTNSYIKDDNWETVMPGEVIVKYVDGSDNEIASQSNLTGFVGISYSTSAKTISGYTYVSRTTNWNGTFTDGNSKVYVIYTYQASAP